MHSGNDWMVIRVRYFCNFDCSELGWPEVHLIQYVKPNYPFKPTLSPFSTSCKNLNMLLFLSLSYILPNFICLLFPPFNWATTTRLFLIDRVILTTLLPYCDLWGIEPWMSLRSHTIPRLLPAKLSFWFDGKMEMHV